MQTPKNTPSVTRHEMLLEQGKRIRALHDIISRPNLCFDKQIDEILRLGCCLLGTEIGKIGRQDSSKNTSEFLNTVVLSDLGAKRGMVLPLDKTFCQITFASPKTIAISHVSESKYKDHPAASFVRMQSYIGCSINVYGKKFGTINFANRTPVINPFTEADKDLVNLMGSWISVMMERQIEAKELRKSKEAADTANQAKSAFLANMSHEIRTPLTALLGYADMLRDENQTPDEIEHEINAIIRAGAHLQCIINDILDLSKIEAGQLVLEKIKMHPAHIMHDVTSIYSTRASEKGINFEVKYHFPIPRNIISDPTRLKQIIFNLCNNAIKFTKQGRITVTMAYLDETQQLKFQISDTGMGMNEEELNRLFTPFSQADSSITRKYGGTGLGLCIARQLTHSLGGDITVTSEKGKGSTFEFTVAVGDVENMHLANCQMDMRFETINETSRNVSKRILVVEDNLDNQSLITKGLSKN